MILKLLLVVTVAGALFVSSMQDRGWWRSPANWVGLVVGGALGALAGWGILWTLR